VQNRRNEFTGVVREYQSSVRAYVRCLGVQADWVDDLAQEVFLVAWRRWDDFDPERNVGNWLFGIARKLVANERRKSRRKTRVVYGPLSEHLLLFMEQRDMRKSYEANHMARFVSECVRKLSVWSQRLLYRRYAEEMNAEQLSRQLKLSPGAVRLRLMRIRKAVRTCIEDKLAQVRT